MKNKKIILKESDIKRLVEQKLIEASWDFDWEDVLGDSGDNKWNDLEKDLSSCLEPLIKKYSDNFGKDSYAVIDAIYQILDGMFQRR